MRCQSLVSAVKPRRSRFAAAERRRRKHEFCRKNRPLLVELFEDRRLLATVNWDGGGDAINWTDPLNWDTNQLPGPADDVIVNVLADPTIHLSSGNHTIKSLVTAEALELDGGGLAITSNSTFDNAVLVTAASILTIQNATIGGTGSLENEGQLVTGGTSVLNAAFHNAGTGTLRLLGGLSGTSLLTVANGFTNDGLIELTSQSGHEARLNVTTGTLDNAGTIRSLLGTGGGPRTLNASITNNGTIELNVASSLSKVDGVYTNANVISVAAGVALGVDGNTFTNMNTGAITGGGTVNLNAIDVFAEGSISALVNVTSSQVNPGELDDDSGMPGVTGNYTQSASSMNIELGGDNPGTGYDQVNINGNAALPGPINVSLINGFVPDPCQVFDVITYGTRTGAAPTFTGLDLGAVVPGLKLRPVITPTKISLVAYNDLDSRINVHPAGVSLSEDGATAEYGVCLATATAPTGTVTVNISHDADVSLSATTLVYDSSTWPFPQQVTVTAVDDPNVEGLHSSLITNASSSSDPLFNNIVRDVTANITDNDLAFVSFVASSSTTPEGTGTHGVDAILDIPSGGILEQAITVDVADAGGGSAGSPADYTFPTQTLTFGINSASGAMQTATINVVDENLVEEDETVNLHLQNLTGPNTAFIDSPNQHEATITDNDTAVFSIDEVTVDEAAGTATFSVSVSNPIDMAVTIDVGYADVTTNGSDFDHTSDQATFQALSTASQQVTVAITDDNLIEATESFLASLSTATALGDRSVDLSDTGTGTITDDDTGDFNDDGLYDCADIDALVAAIAAGNHPAEFDLTGDGQVNLADRDAWLAEAGGVNLGSGRVYKLGDASLDGVVEGVDFLRWNLNKFTALASWCGGDFTADGVVDGLDFVLWNLNKFTSSLSPGSPDSKPADVAASMFSAPSTAPSPMQMRALREVATHEWSRITTARGGEEPIPSMVHGADRYMPAYTISPTAAGRIWIMTPGPWDLEHELRRDVAPAREDVIDLVMGGI